MKTEPTEALKMIGDSFLSASTTIKLKKDAFQAVNVAFKEGQSNPKIKRLEWDRNGTIWHVNQYDPVGYQAAITKWEFRENQYSVRLGLNDGNSSVKIFNSLDEAKDFVQKDFESRVKECLIIE